MKRFILPLLMLALWPPSLAWGESAYLSPQDLNLYQRCFAALNKGRWEEARRESLKGKNPLPAKIILWLDLSRPGPGRSFDDYRKFIASNPDWPKPDTLWAQAERAMPEGLKPNEVISWFNGKEPTTAMGGARLADALSATGKEVVGLVRKTWINRDFDKELETSFAAKWNNLLRSTDQWERMDRLLWDGELDQARSQLARISSSQRNLAMARIKLQRFQPDALAAYAGLTAQQKKDPGAIVDLARFYRKQDADEKAMAALDPPPSPILRPDVLWDELERAARLALEKQNPKLAYRLASAHGAQQGLTFAEGEFLAGWIALRELHDPSKAVMHFGRLYSGTNSSLSKSRGAYWAGLAAEKAGNKEDAAKYFGLASDYPLSYYGQLALEKLGRRNLALAKPIAPSKAELTEFNNKEPVIALRLLHRLKQKDLYKPFLQRLAELAKNQNDISMISSLAKEIGGNNLAIYAAKEARKNGIDVAEPLFPLAPLPRTLSLEPALILGIIRQESAFDPEARSPAGALGMMQLMPSTAKGIAQNLKIGFKPNRLTAEPSYNISLGQHYLSNLVSGFDGSYVLAIAAYNAGPARVRQWLSIYGDPRRAESDVVDWIERIPFDETRNYVQRVLENTQVYRARLEKGTAPLALVKDLRRNEVANVTP